VVIQLGAAAIVVLCLVAIAGSIVSRRTAESQSVHEAAELTDVLGASVVQPVLTDAMANNPAAASAALDGVVRSRVLSDSVVRVKVWTPQGRIIYSDESRLVGMSFPLDDSALAVLATPQTRAEVSDLRAPENRFERSQGKLLEVYRPVWTPSGAPLLFETYFRYDTVKDRASELWRGFVGIMLSSLGVIFVLLLPLVWTLFAKIRRGQAQREALMQRALDASLEERQRIAATLHDGAVQELAAASFAVAGGAETAASRGDVALAVLGLDELRLEVELHSLLLEDALHRLGDLSFELSLSQAKFLRKLICLHVIQTKWPEPRPALMLCHQCSLNEPTAALASRQLKVLYLADPCR